MWANISPNTHFQLKLFSRVDIHGLKTKIASFIVIILQSNKIMTSSNGSLFRVTGNLWGEFTGRQWIPLTEANDAELWCFLWSGPEQTVEKTIKTPVIWNAIMLNMRSLQCHWSVLTPRCPLPRRVHPSNYVYGLRLLCWLRVNCDLFYWYPSHLRN